MKKIFEISHTVIWLSCGSYLLYNGAVIYLGGYLSNNALFYSMIAVGAFFNSSRELFKNP